MNDKQIVICGSEYRTKAAVTKVCRSIIATATDYQPLTERHSRFVAELFRRHPEYLEKSFPGIRAFSVATDSRWRTTRHFIVQRIDGTSIDFSWKICIDQADPDFRSGWKRRAGFNEIENQRIVNKWQISFSPSAMTSTAFQAVCMSGWIFRRPRLRQQQPTRLPCPWSKFTEIQAQRFRNSDQCQRLFGLLIPCRRRFNCPAGLPGKRMTKSTIKFVVGFDHRGSPTVLYLGASLKDAEFAESVGEQSNAYHRVRLYVNPPPTKIYEYNDN
jgi:hypothetical protein